MTVKVGDWIHWKDDEKQWGEVYNIIGEYVLLQNGLWTWKQRILEVRSPKET